MTDDIQFHEKREIIRGILAYLWEHPDSGDALEGIVEWWLLEMKIRYQVSLVKKALEDLVGRELIIEIKRKESPPHYRLNHCRKADIAALLEQKLDCGFPGIE